MRLSSILATLTLIAATSGCGALDRVNDALYATGNFDLEPSTSRAAPECAVTIVAGNLRGRGVIVGKTTVLTVAHVVGGKTEVEVATSGLRWTRAHVVKRIAATPEDVIQLELETSEGTLSFACFDEDRIAKTGEGAPSFVVTATGARGWEHANALRPGDSGSPVLSNEGAVVGLLVGKTRDGSGVLASLGRAKSSTIDATIDASVVARLAASK